ncbi:hypothetical protein [Alteromonas sp. AMM-1]|uniref:hypothetical protein n=1 Tax=Alteromonas sp. AMM-1 TaxID=3394233 RepID=UPI0039A64F37
MASMKMYLVGSRRVLNVGLSVLINIFVLIYISLHTYVVRCIGIASTSHGPSSILAAGHASVGLTYLQYTSGSKHLGLQPSQLNLNQVAAHRPFTYSLAALVSVAIGAGPSELQAVGV